MGTHLLIDIGNSRAKASIRRGEEWLASTSWTDNDAKAIGQLIAAYHPTACALSNVGRPRPELERALRQADVPVLRVDGTTPSPVRQAAASLGADQLAAIVGAMALKPDTDLLVIDSGTCLTYDFVAADGRLLGVNISPGLYLRLQAMHDHTALLPLVSPDGEVPAMGYDTETAMRSGAVLGIRHEIEGAIAQSLRHNPRMHVFLTGGDRFSFNDLPADRISIEPRLVEIGLDALLAYNHLT